MAFIREPKNVDFTVISKEWTEEELKEFSAFIAKSKEKYNKRQAATKKRSSKVRK